MRREAFEQFLRSEKRFSEHTISAYLNDVNQFLLYCEDQFGDDITLTDISNKQIRLWLVALMENGLSAKSINRKLSSLKTFFKFQVRLQEIAINPAVKVVAPKVPKSIPEFVDTRAFDALRQEVYELETWRGLREAVVMEFLYQTGVRLSELLGIRFTDITSRGVKVLGKRNKERMVPIGPELFQLVNQLEHKQQEEMPNNPFMISTVSGKQGYPKLVYNIVKECLKKVTTVHKKSPHVLRHTFATQMLNNGASLNSIKEILGHANLSATQVYTHNSFEKLKTIYNQAHPRA